MAVRFCFVRVLFALNIYVHGGVGSATRILCGIDTERTGGGGGGEQGCGWRLYSWIDRLFSCMKCQRWVKSARHDFPRPSSAQLRARSQTFIIKRGRRASNVQRWNSSKQQKVGHLGLKNSHKIGSTSKITLLWLAFSWDDIFYCSIRANYQIYYYWWQVLTHFLTVPRSNADVSTRLVWSK